MSSFSPRGRIFLPVRCVNSEIMGPMTSTIRSCTFASLKSIDTPEGYPSNRRYSINLAHSLLKIIDAEVMIGGGGFT